MLLEKIRIEKNIKIKDLAAKLNIDSSLMSRILSNKRKPSIAQLKILSEFLEIDFKEILKEYLADEILGVLKEYPTIAKDVLIVAEERIHYLSGKDRFKTISLSKQLTSRLKNLNELSKKWKNIKPLNEIQLRKMEEYFFTSYTYESNRIEGNTLTLQETHLVINEGITIGGKSMREHLELVNHKEAIEFILDLVQNKIPFNAFRLKQIHQIILKGVDDRNAGVYRNLPVRISGSSHVPPEPYLIEKMMEDYFIFYETQKEILHPVILAAEMHERLVTIHPFIDGNGRTSRLVMNLILLKSGFTIANLKGNFNDRMRYYKALEQVQVNHESDLFYELITEHAESSLKEHLHLAGSES